MLCLPLTLFRIGYIQTDEDLWTGYDFRTARIDLKELHSDIPDKAMNVYTHSRRKNTYYDITPKNQT